MLSSERYYLKVAKATDLKSPKERRIYRAFEILPGALAWSTLLGVIFFSWYRPIWVAFFIIAFDVYWLLKTIYLSLHLRASYSRMKKQMALDWQKELEKLKRKGKNWEKIYHLIILPVYQEPFSVVRASFEAIIKSTYPKEKMMVVLAIEERAGQSAKRLAKKIEEEFSNYFYRFLITVHPQDIVGEMPGKGSNTTWAARQAKKQLIDPLNIPYQDVIVSCFDIDTRVYPQYFSCLTYHYLIVKKPTQSSYQPIPVYNNNIWQAPCISRVVATSGTFWQMMQQQRPERLSTFSSQSISFQTLVDVDFWPTNMVSEDSRIFWQNYLYYHSDYQTVPLYYPVSMDANLAPTLFQTAVNIYKQQRRWGWGVENIPYLLFGFYKDIVSGNKIPWRKKWHWTWIQLEGFWSWATNALLIFMLGWLPLFLGGAEFNVTVLSYNLPRITRTLMTLAMVGLVGSAIYSTLLLPPRPRHYSFWRQIGMIIQWILLPFTILIFGSLPGIDAQTRLMLGKYMGFWVTPKGNNKK